MQARALTEAMYHMIYCGVKAVTPVIGGVCVVQTGPSSSALQIACMNEVDRIGSSNEELSNMGNILLEEHNRPSATCRLDITLRIALLVASRSPAASRALGNAGVVTSIKSTLQSEDSDHASQAVLILLYIAGQNHAGAIDAIISADLIPELLRILGSNEFSMCAAVCRALPWIGKAAPAYSTRMIEAGALRALASLVLSQLSSEVEYLFVVRVALHALLSNGGEPVPAAAIKDGVLPALIRDLGNTDDVQLLIIDMQCFNAVVAGFEKGRGGVSFKELAEALVAAGAAPQLVQLVCRHLKVDSCNDDVACLLTQAAVLLSKISASLPESDCTFSDAKMLSQLARLLQRDDCNKLTRQFGMQIIAMNMFNKR